ncbi:hypothetical protein ABW286_13515 [Erwinia papayae]|uniref:Uncharacterized protein n=1 Tax=Erwinia papayae TaxID=206499 RepID=A0ABV3N2Z4_9GAMM
MSNHGFFSSMTSTEYAGILAIPTLTESVIQWYCPTMILSAISVFLRVANTWPSLHSQG